MTKLWEKPPFSYTVKENVGGGTGLSGSKSFSTWVALSQRGKRRAQPRGPGMGGFSDFHSAAVPLGPGRRRCERECHYLTQHVPKPQKRSDVCKKHVAHSYLIRGISRSFLHCLDIQEVLLCPYISLSLSVCLSASNYCDLIASNTKQYSFRDIICNHLLPHCQIPIV